MRPPVLVLTIAAVIAAAWAAGSAAWQWWPNHPLAFLSAAVALLAAAFVDWRRLL